MTDMARQREGEAAVSGPTTEAGRALLNADHAYQSRKDLIDAILAIEAEAHAAGRAAALGELDAPVAWLAENYPKAMREMPTELFRRFDRARAALDATETKGDGA